ncbi:MAG: prepilin-type cleavage/methylation domain-containing protein [Deltaproteobacteria bacterium]|nr:MAG: prepilin-type cleavage/methylation domain-containing protein [Deltaproteobacteria bacterium]
MGKQIKRQRQDSLKIQANKSEKILNEKGITLIEIMVVIGILAIVSAFAYPNFKNWLPGYRLKQAARNLFSDMQKVRMNAIKRGINMAIVFDTTNNRYLICSSAGADGNWSTLSDNTVDETVDLTSYKSGIRYGHGNATTALGGSFDTDNVTFPNNTVIFTPRGVLGSGGGYCYIENEKDSTYAIGALTTGVIMLKKWYGSSWQ